MPDNSTIGIADTSNTDDRALFGDHQLPHSAVAMAGRCRHRRRDQLREQPPKFDAAGLVSQQFEAVSSDGTKILISWSIAAT